jgi:hypothetical protein
MDRIEFVMGDVIAAAVANAKAGTPTVVLHVVNDRHGWGAGFTGRLSVVWPEPERYFRATAFQLGQVQWVPVAPSLTVINACAQRGYSKPGQPAFVLDALRLCVQRAVRAYPDFDFFLPRVGSGLGGGSWPEIVAMLSVELASVPRAVVYTLPKV